MSNSDHDRNDQSARAQRVARLAALQRLRDQAQANDRKALLSNLEKMIEAELRALRSTQSDREPHG